MKAKLELNLCSRATFLNFWNAVNGRDVVCEIVGGKLMLSTYDRHGNQREPKEITLATFVRMVRARMKVIAKEAERG